MQQISGGYDAALAQWRSALDPGPTAFAEQIQLPRCNLSACQLVSTTEAPSAETHACIRLLHGPSDPTQFIPDNQSKAYTLLC